MVLNLNIFENITEDPWHFLTKIIIAIDLYSENYFVWTIFYYYMFNHFIAKLSQYVGPKWDK